MDKTKEIARLYKHIEALKEEKREQVKDYNEQIQAAERALKEYVDNLDQMALDLD